MLKLKQLKEPGVSGLRWRTGWWAQEHLSRRVTPRKAKIRIKCEDWYRFTSDVYERCSRVRATVFLPAGSHDLLEYCLWCIPTNLRIKWRQEKFDDHHPHQRKEDSCQEVGRLTLPFGNNSAEQEVKT